MDKLPHLLHGALSDPGSGGTGLSAITSGQVTATDEFLSKAEINQYTGPNSSQRIRILGNHWPANRITQIDTVYMEFAVSPKTGYSFKVNSLSLGIAGVGINTLKANVYYSSDVDFSNPVQVNYTTDDTSGNNYLGRDSILHISDSPNIIVNTGETFYIRVYPWVDNDPTERTGKYIAIQDVKVDGITQMVPSPASVIWPLTNPANGGTGLTPITSGQLNAEDEILNNTEINGYGGPNFSQRIRILGNEWPTLQTTQIDTVFVEFAVKPKMGYAFTVNSVSLGIAGVSINTMKANIYYSIDSTFTNSIQINYTTADTSGNNYLGRDSLQYVSASPSVKVNQGETFYVRVYPWVDNDPTIRTGKYSEFRILQ